MSPLKQKLLKIIRAAGPISLADYMMMALYDRDHGYYTTKNPIGAGGDFTTSPEISQIFGELIGAFLVQAWEDRGRPSRFHLVELGPGRGTLMADILRAAHVRPAFLDAAQITLVETSPTLRAAQAKTIARPDLHWTDAIDQVPNDAPTFLVANEFFDAMPVRQFVKAKDGWHERMVGADGDRFVFALAPNPTALRGVPDVQDGAVYEVSPASLAIATMIAERIARHGGIALTVDYGHAGGFGDTFQAVKAHMRTDPLAEPGEADLTAHVDFSALANAARNVGGVGVRGPVTQGAFLTVLGIRERAEALSRAQPDHAADIRAALDRLTGERQMGTLFKVLCLTDRPTPPPGFL